MNTTTAPITLHDISRAGTNATPEKTLSQLLYDGYYLINLIRQGHVPQNPEIFTGKIEALLTLFENQARKLNASTDDIFTCKYAFCGLLDEIILQTESPCRAAWQLQPLQLRFFGDHLAGEHFFDKLEEVRAHGKIKEQVLEVMYTCMLLGFRGKYLLETPEKLNYLIGRVGDELRGFHGHTNKLAPFWAIPDNIKNLIKFEVPLWVFWLVFGLLALTVFGTFSWLLDRHFKEAMAPYSSIIQSVDKPPYLEITW